MARPVTETVHFNVNLNYLERDGKYIAVTLQTGVITVGSTQQEATEAAARWNTFIVAAAKQNGRRELRRYLQRRGISYQLDSQGVPRALNEVEALKNVPLATMLDKGEHVELAA
jgi:predicted RNase H-like HicB family nuclease